MSTPESRLEEERKKKATETLGDSNTAIPQAAVPKTSKEVFKELWKTPPPPKLTEEQEKKIKEIQSRYRVARGDIVEQWYGLIDHWADLIAAGKIPMTQRGTFLRRAWDLLKSGASEKFEKLGTKTEPEVKPAQPIGINVKLDKTANGIKLTQSVDNSPQFGAANNNMTRTFNEWLAKDETLGKYEVDMAPGSPTRGHIVTKVFVDDLVAQAADGREIIVNHADLEALNVAFDDPDNGFQAFFNAKSEKENLGMQITNATKDDDLVPSSGHTL